MKLSECTKCKLYKTRTQVVKGLGNKNSEIIFIGQNPGSNEDKEGKPFIGKAGKVLDKVIKKLGWLRKEVYITNSVKCLTPNNRNPLDLEIAKCSNWFKRELNNNKKKKLIITLGAAARKTVRNLMDDLIGFYTYDDTDGEYVLYSSRKYGVHVYNILHPASIFYSEINSKKFYKQIEVLNLYMMPTINLFNELSENKLSKIKRWVIKLGNNTIGIKTESGLVKNIFCKNDNFAKKILKQTYGWNIYSVIRSFEQEYKEIEYYRNYKTSLIKLNRDKIVELANKV
jgi:DNA polymerase